MKGTLKIDVREPFAELDEDLYIHGTNRDT